jgi:hypothetical protein
MQAKIRLLIYVALWKRPEITEICFMGIQRLRSHPDFEVYALAVASEPEMETLGKKYGVSVLMHENLPLGQKKNAGLKAASGYQFDYMMEIGSDTIVLSELLDYYKKDFIGQYDFFGVSDMAFLDSETLKCRRKSRKLNHYGAGRMMSRPMLQTMDFKIWPDHLNMGLDNSSISKLAKHGFFYRQAQPSETPLVMELKSDVNIWPFNHLEGELYDVNLILDKLSAEEVSAIKELHHTYA